MPACRTDRTGGNVGGVIAYSFADCLNACAAMADWSGACTALTFEPMVFTDGNNCWLKNVTGNVTAHTGAISATLMPS
jgi:hypothetical protein